MSSSTSTSWIKGLAFGLALSLSGPLAVAKDDSKGSSARSGQDGEERVCKRVAVTGRRIKERVCYKRKTWDRMSEESRDNLDRYQQSRGVNSGIGSDG